MVPRVVALGVDAEEAGVLVAGGEGVEAAGHAVGRHTLRELRGSMDALAGAGTVRPNHLADEHERHAVGVGPAGALERHRQAQLVVGRVVVAHAHLRARPRGRLGGHQLVRRQPARGHALELARHVLNKLVVVHRARRGHHRARRGVVRLDVRLKVRLGDRLHVITAAQDGVGQRRVLVRRGVQVVVHHLLRLLLHLLHLA
mmetsp:Transcript_14583/g.45581  ORF Transcript_14583/g.45581 Transcript_14583/m.45581 type:complete len:201 (+) Transcript_14583:945-1547(+)